MAALTPASKDSNKKQANPENEDSCTVKNTVATVLTN
jgi:hypothetical protein